MGDAKLMSIKKHKLEPLSIDDKAIVDVIDKCLSELRRLGGEDLIAMVTVSRDGKAYSVSKTEHYERAMKALQSIVAKGKKFDPEQI